MTTTALEQAQKRLETLFQQFFEQELALTSWLPPSGSDRRYLRMQGEQGAVALGVWHPDKRENELFVRYSQFFAQAEQAVPQIYAQDLAQQIYLLQDLGDTTLLQHKLQNPWSEVETYYQQALAQLAFWQIKLGPALGEDLPRFDRLAMLWDCQQFKYYFLRVRHPQGYDEYALERDFEALVQSILADPQDYFLFRDFQARNILIHEDKTYFIDYQSAKRGPLGYDLASLLYQAKAGLSAEQRETLFRYYQNLVAPWLSSAELAGLRANYERMILLRSLQVLGAYGFKGYFEGKPHFLESIPAALANIRELLDQGLLRPYPCLAQILAKLAEA